MTTRTPPPKRKVSVPSSARPSRPSRPSRPAATPKRDDLRRDVPSLDAILRSAAGRKAADRLGRPLVKQALHAVLDDVRAAAAGGSPPPGDAELLARALQAAALDLYGIAQVLKHIIA